MDSQRAGGEGQVLWQPSAARIEATRMRAYRRWLQRERGLRFADHTALWQSAQLNAKT